MLSQVLFGRFASFCVTPCIPLDCTLRVIAVPKNVMFLFAFYKLFKQGDG